MSRASAPGKRPDRHGKRATTATTPRAASAQDRAPSRRRRAAAWELRLYVAGQTPRSLAAFRNLTAICEEHLKGQYRIEVIDLLEHPKLAADDQIVAIPTLVRKLPEPIRKIVGDLSDTVPVLVGLQLRPGA